MGEALRAWCDVSRRRDSVGLNTATELSVRRLLRLARERMRTDVTWLAQDNDGMLVIRFLDGDGSLFHLTEGTTLPPTGTYYSAILAGRIPRIIPDTVAEPATAALTSTQRYNIRAYIGQPVTLHDGQIYGVLFCASDHPELSLSDQDVDTMAMLADMVADLVEPYVAAQRRAAAFRHDIVTILGDGGPWAVRQPIVDIVGERTVAVEALARFPPGKYDTEEWFDEARAAGCGIEMETDALNAALDLLATLPQDIRLALNASADMITSGALTKVLAGRPYERLIVELTERHRTLDVPSMLSALRDLREGGALLAVDDAGSGYSNLHQILDLGPDIVKLDKRLVSGIDGDPMKRAMCKAFVAFSEEARIMLVAEGVETAAEMRELASLGVRNMQGYYISPPGPAATGAG
jgi:EAL domain-containing protein (putative c-di-GMP-specific phosphodiesterase class I)